MSKQDLVLEKYFRDRFWVDEWHHDRLLGSSKRLPDDFFAFAQLVTIVQTVSAFACRVDDDRCEVLGELSTAKMYGYQERPVATKHYKLESVESLLSRCPGATHIALVNVGRKRPITTKHAHVSDCTRVWYWSDLKKGETDFDREVANSLRKSGLDFQGGLCARNWNTQAMDSGPKIGHVFADGHVGFDKTTYQKPDRENYELRPRVIGDAWIWRYNGVDRVSFTAAGLTNLRPRELADIVIGRRKFVEPIPKTDLETRVLNALYLLERQGRLNQYAQLADLRFAWIDSGRRSRSRRSNKLRRLLESKLDELLPKPNIHNVKQIANKKAAPLRVFRRDHYRVAA